VDSAGTAGYHIGKAPDIRSIEVALQAGIDISQQKCRRFTPDDFDNFDYIFAMDRENLLHLRDLARTTADLKKLYLLLEEAGIPGEEVPDPYYGGTDGFQIVFRMIDAATDKLLPLLAKS
jgi:protein-tyrosine phosphatase